MSANMHPAELRIDPALQMRDGRSIRSLADAMALVREHESRPGIDTRDEVLHRLERAQTDQERRQALQAFVAWAQELDLFIATPVKTTGS
jgi:hypothetical protein